MINLAFHIQRGGSGKTTLTGNLGAVLARSRNVVVIDGDPQGSLSSWLAPGRQEHELADLFCERMPASKALVQLSPSLSLLGTFGIGGELKKYAETDLYRQPFAIKKVTEQLAGLGYDVALWDLAPGMSMLERAILAQMAEVISPVMLEDFSLDGIEIFTTELERIRRDYMAAELRHTRIVANGFNRSIGRHIAYLEQFRKLNGFQLYTFAQDQAVPEAQAEHRLILEATRKLKSENLTELERLGRDLIGS
jgi:cellulose biosynthesis protein BcsQ